MPRPIKHGGRWWHRKRVPADIRATYPKKEEWAELGTDLAIARRRMPDAMKAVQARFDTHRAALNGHAPTTRFQLAPAGLIVSRYGHAFDTIDEACRFFYEACQAHEQISRVNHTKRTLEDAEAFWRGEIIPLPETYDRDHETPAMVLKRAYDKRLANRLHSLKSSLAILDLFVCSIAAKREFGEAVLENTELLIALGRTEIQFYEAMLRDADAIFFIPAPSVWPPVDSASSSSDRTPLLSVAAAVWSDQRSKDWSKERLKFFTSIWTLLVEIVGDKSVGSYGKEEVRQYKTVLSALPSHRTKRPLTRGLSARDAAQKAKVHNLPLIDAKTANDYIGLLAEFFEWVQDSYDGVNVNPFEDVKFPHESSPRDEGAPFTADDLVTIFASPTFNEKREDTAKFWAPVLLLYTGCRANEILKLKVSDIREEDGIHYFDINEQPHKDTRIKPTLKEATNPRRIPLHADVIAFGFLDFVTRQSQERSERLFPELTPGHNGKFSDAFGKWFNRLLKRLGVKRAKIDVRSFRQAWVDACHNSRIPDYLILRLKDGTGSAPGTLSRYGHGKTDLEILSEEIIKLRFKGLDLSHLQVIPRGPPDQAAHHNSLTD